MPNARIAGKRSDAKHHAARKALAFAESFLAVESLVAFPHDWQPAEGARWQRVHVDDRTLVG